MSKFITYDRMILNTERIKKVTMTMSFNTATRRSDHYLIDIHTDDEEIQLTPIPARESERAKRVFNELVQALDATEIRMD